jgi:hypothetical protein
MSQNVYCTLPRSCFILATCKLATHYGASQDIVKTDGAGLALPDCIDEKSNPTAIRTRYRVWHRKKIATRVPMAQNEPMPAEEYRRGH